MDTRRQRPTQTFRDRGPASVEDVYGEDWQRRNPMDFVAPQGVSRGLEGGTNPRDFVPNWDFNSLMQSLHPRLDSQGPEPMNPFARPIPPELLNGQKQMLPPKPEAVAPPTQPITLPPEAFRDPSQFVTPIPPPQISTSSPSQDIDIPEIRNQAPQLPQSIPSGVPGIEIRPGNKMPIRGRYRF